VMNRFDPAEVHAVPRGVAPGDHVCAPLGLRGEPCVNGV